MVWLVYSIVVCLSRDMQSFDYDIRWHTYPSELDGRGQFSSLNGPASEAVELDKVLLALLRVNYGLIRR